MLIILAVQDEMSVPEEVVGYVVYDDEQDDVAEYHLATTQLFTSEEEAHQYIEAQEEMA